VTEADVIAHWQNGARAEVESAKLLLAGGQYPGALFHCHLAVEKALKAVYMRNCRKEPPLTHDLLQIAAQLPRVWTNAGKQLLADLTGYAVAARYDDPGWAEREAAAVSATSWIRRVDALISSLLP
jgi:HEPN domain-containing protein